MDSADWTERRVWLFAGLIVAGVIALIVLALLPNPKMPSRADVEEHTRRRMEAMDPGPPAGPDELVREAHERQREATERHDAAEERARRAVEELENGP